MHVSRRPRLLSRLAPRRLPSLPPAGAGAAPHTGDAGGKALPPASPARRPRRFTAVVTSVQLRASAEQVFAFHADVRNLPRLTPSPLRVLHAPVPTRAGDLQVLELGPAPLRRRWHARVVRFDPPRSMVDVQERGPFRLWRHTHAVIPEPGGARLVDAVEFRLLSGPLGPLLDALVVAPLLRLLFAERHRRTRRYLERSRPGR